MRNYELKHKCVLDHVENACLLSFYSHGTIYIWTSRENRENVFPLIYQSASQAHACM